MDVSQTTESMPNDSSRKNGYREPHHGHHRSTRSRTPPQPNLDHKLKTPASPNGPKNQRYQPNPPRNSGQAFHTAQILTAEVPRPPPDFWVSEARSMRRRTPNTLGIAAHFFLVRTCVSGPGSATRFRPKPTQTSEAFSQSPTRFPITSFNAVSLTC
jgi:hypothetical protein